MLALNQTHPTANALCFEHCTKEMNNVGADSNIGSSEQSQQPWKQAQQKLSCFRLVYVIVTVCACGAGLQSIRFSSWGNVRHAQATPFSYWIGDLRANQLLMCVVSVMSVFWGACELGCLAQTDWKISTREQRSSVSNSNTIFLMRLRTLHVFPPACFTIVKHLQLTYKCWTLQFQSQEQDIICFFLGFHKVTVKNNSPIQSRTCQEAWKQAYTDLVWNICPLEILLFSQASLRVCTSQMLVWRFTCWFSIQAYIKSYMEIIMNQSPWKNSNHDYSAKI